MIYTRRPPLEWWTGAWPDARAADKRSSCTFHHFSGQGCHVVAIGYPPSLTSHVPRSLWHSHIRTVDYYYLSIPGDLGEATEALASLAERGINLLAFAAVPMGPHRTQLTIFPDESPQLEDEASTSGLRLEGPHPALLVQGDDELGALAVIHRRLSDAGIPVFSSSGVTDGRGRFGYVLYIRPDAVERAQAALGL